MRRLVQGRHIGIHRSPYRGSAAEFAEHRPYLPGDNIRHIDWRVFARTDRFYVKRHEEETNLTARVILDASASMNFEKKWDAAALLAGTIVYVLCAQGDAVGLTFAAADAASGPRAIEPRRGRMHLHEMMDVLGSAAPSGAGSITEAVDQSIPRTTSGRAGLVVVISDFLSEDPDALNLAFRRIRKLGHDAFVLHIISRAELDLSAVGPTLYLDPETGEKVETMPEEVRAVYRRHLDGHLQRVSGVCRSLDFDHLLVVAEDGPGVAFGRFLASRTQRAHLR